MSSKRLAKTSSKRPPDVLQKRLQNIFKTSLRRFQDVFKTPSRHLQDVFKTYHEVKLFLLTRFENEFETYLKPF